MKREIDCRGMSCPKPVIMTKKEIDSMIEGSLITIVDNEVAKENISKLATSMSLNFNVEKIKDDEYHITIQKGEIEDIVVKPKVELFKENTIAIGSDKMGKGDEVLGKILIKSFIYTIKETSPLPASIVLFNSGVYLTCEGSEVLDDLKDLAKQGVEIESCGTCLDYYYLKEKLAVGGVTNMYNIYEKMRNANTISIS